jgi:hypothetical protein
MIASMNPTAHFESSTLRERIIEHLFIGEVLRTLWRRGVVNVEVLRSEFDAHGYDLIMAYGRIIRHIQFKTGTSSKPGNVSISLALASKPSGCVLWIHVSDTLELRPFFWFGGAPGDPLPPLDDYEIPMRATHNKDGERPLRKNHRLIPGNQFQRLETLDKVLEALFGHLHRVDSSVGP